VYLRGRGDLLGYISAFVLSLSPSHTHTHIPPPPSLPPSLTHSLSLSSPTLSPVQFVTFHIVNGVRVCVYVRCVYTCVFFFTRVCVCVCVCVYVCVCIRAAAADATTVSIYYGAHDQGWRARKTLSLSHTHTHTRSLALSLSLARSISLSRPFLLPPARAFSLTRSLYLSLSPIPPSLCLCCQFICPSLSGGDACSGPSTGRCVRR
jgi:hypothetical protein